MPDLMTNRCSLSPYAAWFSTTDWIFAFDAGTQCTTKPGGETFDQVRDGITFNSSLNITVLPLIGRWVVLEMTTRGRGRIS